MCVQLEPLRCGTWLLQRAERNVTTNSSTAVAVVNHSVNCQRSQALQVLFRQSATSYTLHTVTR
jgi:hypothetical protein